MDGKISAVATAVAAGDHRSRSSYAGDARFQPNTATATLTVKEPVANPNAAGAAAAQASNPCPASASACVDLSNEQAWLQIGRADHLRPGADHLGRVRLADPGRHVLGVLAGQEPQVQPVQRRADAELGVLRRRHRLPPGQPVDQSNGCIHLSWDASETFFDTLSVGDGVYVWGAAPY